MRTPTQLCTVARPVLPDRCTADKSIHCSNPQNLHVRNRRHQYRCQITYRIKDRKSRPNHLHNRLLRPILAPPIKLILSNHDQSLRLELLLLHRQPIAAQKRLRHRCHNNHRRQILIALYKVLRDRRSKGGSQSLMRSLLDDRNIPYSHQQAMQTSRSRHSLPCRHHNLMVNRILPSTSLPKMCTTSPNGLMAWRKLPQSQAILRRAFPPYAWNRKNTTSWAVRTAENINLLSRQSRSGVVEYIHYSPPKAYSRLSDH